MEEEIDIIKIRMEYFEEMHNIEQKDSSEEQEENGDSLYNREYTTKEQITLEEIKKCKAAGHEEITMEMVQSLNKNE